ncbi:MAG: LPS assembly protein LptD [Candidatus Omnitrophica bacterium]|nr:LPS assembly protein LptD [Candidatus Omnitrophota bacterium]
MNSHNSNFSIIFMIFVTVIMVTTSSLFAEELPIEYSAEKQEVYMKDDKIVKVILKGNVEIKKGSLTIRGDKVIYEKKRNEIWAPGNVVFLQEGSRIEGKDLLYNIGGESGSLKEVSFFSPPWYGKGETAEIKKKGEYLIRNGYMTTCDLDPPHYRFQAKKIKIFVGKKLVARKITFYVRKVPILYLPHYSQSLEKEAESIFSYLLGYSDDWGWYLLTTLTPFLKHYTASYHLDFRERKGIGLGLDLKKKPKGGEKGILKTYYIKEADTDEEDENRYRLSYKYRNVWEKEGRDLTLLSELHKLSDDEFLKDYAYNDYLEEAQPRTYLSFSERKPERFLNLLARTRVNDFYPVTERLPEMNLSFPIQNLGKNLYFRSETNLVNLRKEIDDEVRNSVRLDTFNEIMTSKRYGGWLNVRPHVGSRFTFYTEDAEGNNAFRSLGEAGIDFGTKFQKPFTIKESSLTHIVEPRVSLDCREVSLDPEELLNFDSLDNLHSDKYINLQLINRVCSGEGKKKSELSRLNLKSHYSLVERRFEDASLILGITPKANWSFSAESDYDIPENRWKTSTSSFSWWKKKYTFGLSHSYEYEVTNSLVPSIYWKINPDWQARFTTSYRLAEKDFESRKITLYRDLHCWASSVSFYRSSSERSIYFILYLKAFPLHPVEFTRTYEIE